MGAATGIVFAVFMATTIINIFFFIKLKENKNTSKLVLDLSEAGLYHYIFDVVKGNITKGYIEGQIGSTIEYELKRVRLLKAQGRIEAEHKD